MPAYDPPAVPPLIEPVLGPPPTPDTVLPAFPPAQEPQTETSAPPTSESKPDATHATGLPSRRELRKRTEGESEGPLSAHASAPQQPAPDSAVPPTFDWMVAGSPATPATTAAAAAPTAPVTQTSPAPSTGVQAEPAAASGPMAVPASSAWAQEPAAVATDPEELYGSTATRKATVSGWFIAVMPLIAGVLAIGAVKGAENYPRYVPEGVEWWMLAGGVVVVLYLVTLLLAVADRRKLDWAGYNHPAHWAWAILTAPVYLLVRTIVVRRETGRNSALLWVWIVLAAVLVGAWFAARTFAPTLIDGYSLPFL
ncbi:hypothetical protein BKA04_002315 [Cryobacterium mesophilum]|nr:hypothetical protein [Terrimesophilobacter mesophilus]